jgi:hypothetical protein
MSDTPQWHDPASAAWGGPDRQRNGWSDRPDGPWHGGWGTPPGRAYPPTPAGFGRAIPIIAMILGFLLWWPVGLAILFYLWWSGQMGCWGRHARAGGTARDGRPGLGGWAAWFACRNQMAAEPPSSGNRAFDEYRADTLRRLEEEQKAFAAYLDRLRFAKDKAEFDQFMAERWERPRPEAGPTPAN